MAAPKFAAGLLAQGSSCATVPCVSGRSRGVGRWGVVAVVVLCAGLCLSVAAVPARAQDVAVTPDGGTVNPPPNTLTQVQFWIQNNTPWDFPGVLECTTSGAASSCSVQRTITIPAYTGASVSVSFQTGASGTGTVTLISQTEAGSWYDEGSYNVVITKPPVVTPDGGSVMVGAYTSGHSVSYTIANPNSFAITYALSCSYSAPVTSCTRSAPSVTVPANSSGSASVSYAVGGVGSGSVSLSASGSGGGLPPG